MAACMKCDNCVLPGPAAAIDAIATTSGGLLFAAAGNEAVDNDKVPSYPASYVTNSNNIIAGECWARTAACCKG